MKRWNFAHRHSHWLPMWPPADIASQGRTWMQVPQTTDCTIKYLLLIISLSRLYSGWAEGKTELGIVCRKVFIPVLFDFSTQKGNSASCPICDQLDFLQHVYQNSLGLQTNHDTFIWHFKVICLSSLLLTDKFGKLMYVSLCCILTEIWKHHGIDFPVMLPISNGLFHNHEEKCRSFLLCFTLFCLLHTNNSGVTVT